jgi:transcriptional regulator with XRE-family HTH domain
MPPISAGQVRAARGLLQWSQADLAKHANVTIPAIAAIEANNGKLAPNDVEAVKEALERAGVAFTPGGATLVHQLSLHFMSQDNAAELQMRYTTEGAAGVQELMGLFGEVANGAASLNAVQSATKAFKAALNGLVSKHAAAVPQLHGLRKFVDALRDDEFFLLLPESSASTAEKYDRERLLHRLNHPDADHGDDQTQALFGKLLANYDIATPRTDRRTVIGNKQPAARKCRFCHRTAADGAIFESAAHAIPTALGNDHLKIADECDECNNHFGRETEPSLIAMLDIQRAFLGIQGRGKNDGRPELQFSKGKVFHDGRKLNIHATDVAKDEATDEISVQLGKGAAMVPVAAYRALVKIALSVVKADQLPDLAKTIEWLREGKHGELPLPTVAAAVIGLPPNPSAQITLYVRKDGAETRLPHIVAEFRLGCYLYVYAIPFSDRDSWDLVGFFDDPEFRDVFRHYAAVQGWSQQDLSGQNKIAMIPLIKFVPRTP